MEKSQIESVANDLYEARVNAAPVQQFSDRFDDFPRSDAYSIQELGIDKRLADGETLVGMKMGLTSEAKRQQMNLDAPLYGALTDKMKVDNGGSFSMKGKIHPKIEPEVGFIIKSELKGKVTREEVLAATSAVFPALEILDSRYEQFKYFSMEDVISDNSSSSHFICGDLIEDFSSIDLANLKMVMSANGTVAQEGNSKAISDDPVISVIQLAELLAERGKGIQPGWLVLAGAATPALALEPGLNVTLEVESLGNLSVTITE